MWLRILEKEKGTARPRKPLWGQHCGRCFWDAWPKRCVFISPVNIDRYNGIRVRLTNICSGFKILPRLSNCIICERGISKRHEERSRLQPCALLQRFDQSSWEPFSYDAMEARAQLIDVLARCALVCVPFSCTCLFVNVC